MGRHDIQLTYLPAEGISPAHVLRALTAALEDQARPAAERDDPTVDLAAIAEEAGAGALGIDPGSVTCRSVTDGGPTGLVLELVAIAADGADPATVEAGCRRFASAALHRRLGGRSLTEVGELTLDLDPARIDLTEQGATSQAGPAGPAGPTAAD